MPLKIYLDTQDYLNLYKNRTSEQQIVYDYLCSKIDAGYIVVGFSYAIISEILQEYTPEHKNDRILRAQTIKRMCQKNCFVFTSALRRESTFNTSGKWYPPIGNVFSIDQLKETLKSEVIALIRREFPYANKSELRKATEWKSIIKFLRANRKALNNPETLKIPVSKRFIEEDILAKYLLGEIDKASAEKEFLEIITDIELFIEAWFEHGKKGNYMYEMMLNVNAGYEKIINIARSSAEKITEIKRGIRDMEEKIFRGELPKSFLEETKNLKMKTKSVPELLDENIARIRLDKEVIKNFPDSFFDAFSIYIHHQSKANTPIKASDAADLMHACYIPYCDLWRGDKAFSTALVNGGIKDKEKIVTSLYDLPKRIDALLNRGPLK